MAAGRAQMGRGNTSQPIYLDEVTCIGNEPNVTLCHHASYGASDCSHFEDAGVVCDGKWWGVARGVACCVYVCMCDV